MTYENKKRAAQDALIVVGDGLRAALDGSTNWSTKLRAAYNTIEGLLRDAIDKCREQTGGKEAKRVLRRLHIVSALYLDMAEELEFTPKEMERVQTECAKLAMEISTLVLYYDEDEDEDEDELS